MNLPNITLFRRAGVAFGDDGRLIMFLLMYHVSRGAEARPDLTVLVSGRMGRRCHSCRVALVLPLCSLAAVWVRPADRRERPAAVSRVAVLAPAAVTFADPGHRQLTRSPEDCCWPTDRPACCRRRRWSAPPTAARSAASDCSRRESRSLESIRREFFELLHMFYRADKRHSTQQFHHLSTRDHD